MFIFAAASLSQGEDPLFWLANTVRHAPPLAEPTIYLEMATAPCNRRPWTTVDMPVLGLCGTPEAADCCSGRPLEASRERARSIAPTIDEHVRARSTLLAQPLDVIIAIARVLVDVCGTARPREVSGPSHPFPTAAGSHGAFHYPKNFTCAHRTIHRLSEKFARVAAFCDHRQNSSSRGATH